MSADRRPFLDRLAVEAKAARSDSALKAFLRAGPLTLDASRENLPEKALALLLTFVEESGFKDARAALFAGENVNPSEKRPALHMALRASSGAVMVQGQDVLPAILAERKRALAFADKLRAGSVKGANGKTIRHLIHVGIGGSELGPRLLVQALGDEEGPFVHFIASADAQPLQWLMDALDPSETFVTLASKSFSTAEVLRNGKTLLSWLEKALGGEAKNHLLAVTAAPQAAKSFGVRDEHIFRLWDFIGGRFSVCSSVSLCAMAAMGPRAFEEFLRGAEEIDRHFQSAPLAQNLPVMLALLALWNINGRGLSARAVLPYIEALSLWPSYLQQLEMESLGKRVDKDGRAVDYATSPVVFGASGTPAQHAFMQALHQGTQIIPAEILIVKKTGELKDHQHLLQANAIAQAESLAHGRQASETGENDSVLAAQKSFEGGRPSSILLLDELSPAALGALIALYEHKVFVLGHLWNINPFDQWGVELGKQLAGPFEAYLAGSGAVKTMPALLREIKDN